MPPPPAPRRRAPRRGLLVAGAAVAVLVGFGALTGPAQEPAPAPSPPAADAPSPPPATVPDASLIAVPGPVSAMVLAPAGERLYVTSAPAGAPETVSVIDTATATVTASFPAGTDVQVLRELPDGRVVVATTTALAIVEPATGSREELPFPGSVAGASDDGATLYVPDAEPDPDAGLRFGLGALDVAGGSPRFVAETDVFLRAVPNPDGREVYLDAGAGVSAVDLTTGTVAELPVTGFVASMTVTSDGRHLLVATDAGLLAVDTATRRLTGRSDLVEAAAALAPGRSRVHVATYRGELVALDVATGAGGPPVAIGVPVPTALAVSPDARVASVGGPDGVAVVPIGG
ncbi:MAG: hypothetical protein ACT4RN_16620 [Pseudonocardia sp.]